MENRKILITGAGGVASGKVVGDIINEQKEKTGQMGQHLVLVSGRSRAERFAQDLSFFCDGEILMWPDDEGPFIKYEARNQDQNVQRAKIIRRLETEPNLVLVAPASGGVVRLPAKEDYKREAIILETNKEISLEDFRDRLVVLGYEREEVVENPGQFSVRGGIIDIFVPWGDDPYRVEFFGDEIESIRCFDAESQRSIERVDSLKILPMGKGENQGDLTDHIWDYMDKPTIIIEDEGRIREHLELREKELWNDFEFLLEKGQADKEEAKWITGMSDLEQSYNMPCVYFIQTFAKQINGNETFSEIRSFRYLPVTKYNNHIELFRKDLHEYVEKGNQVIIACSSERRLESLTQLVREESLTGKVSLKEGNLSSGLITDNNCIISDGDIFDSKKISGRKKHKSFKSGKKIHSFTELKVGEYVVHENHGIGIFQGIEELYNLGVHRDFIKIKYQGHGVLYVPVEQMDEVQKYIGSEGKAPKINKLGSDEWRRTKQRAKKAISDMTDELVELYAKRKAERGYAFSEDTVWQQDFEDSFPFEETEDQLKSIEEIKADMEEERPMDRLLCGDVGYGKTEVAARAIFKCLIEGKQAAMLVPTTILASQHYNNLKERFKDYPFKIELMSRFRSEKELEEIAKKIKKDKVDFVIGTHRLLSGDVEFYDLGLLVIDEEQRFGVAHKEKIKKLKTGVDVLTLSATPIPRTLNMSLTGIRDMSLITEPPEERYPVQTYVMEQDEDLIREIITRELDRGGQCFLVYNRVRGILRIAEMVRRLVPEARVGVGHGQMSEKALEEVMDNFVSGETDVLVATTIVESGLDIPNANTMIVLDADKCGLSQLYQLRGRVGRSNKIAYAYLMYQKEKVLTEIAEKRLKAVREFTEFGAGFKIAMRDMELRGAGNVLGAEQSGHMLDVGYEMYARMVEEASRRARGEIVYEKKDDFTVELKTEAGIPSWYISDYGIKLSMYKRIADIETPADKDDVMAELSDRFGTPPLETRNLVYVSCIRSLAARAGLSRLFEHNGRVNMVLDSDNHSMVYAIMKVNEAKGDQVFFHGGQPPYLSFAYTKNSKLEKTLEILTILADNQSM